MMSEELFDVLLRKYLLNELDNEELDLFLNYIEKYDDLFLKSKLDGLHHIKFDYNIVRSNSSKKVHPLYNSNNKTRPHISYFKVASIAASIILFLSMIYYYAPTDQNNAVLKSDILLPEHEIIISRNNIRKSITLSDTSKNILFGNVTFAISVDGSLSYSINESNTIDNSAITVEAPRGKNSYLKLADGSHVWINAMSKVTFKPYFSSNIRRISLEGEAFFEVVKDKLRPFVVNTKKSSIKVLGTAFNVKAYDNDTYEKNTLIHGKVKINTASSEAFILPNQQFVVDVANN